MLTILRKCSKLFENSTGRKFSFLAWAHMISTNRSINYSIQKWHNLQIPSRKDDFLCTASFRVFSAKISFALVSNPVRYEYKVSVTVSRVSERFFDYDMVGRLWGQPEKWRLKAVRCLAPKTENVIEKSMKQPMVTPSIKYCEAQVKSADNPKG